MADDGARNREKWEELKGKLKEAQEQLDIAVKAIGVAKLRVNEVLITPPGTFPVAQENVPSRK